MMVDNSYMKNGYKSEKWKWVQSLKEKKNLLDHPNLIFDLLTSANVSQTYGLKKAPKCLPCQKKCNANPWCLATILKETKSSAARLTEQLRDMSQPVGLENTANTCWINSALQALFHIYQFRNCINSIDGFQGEENLSSLDYLLQAVFVEMELHKNKALACTSESVFEKLAVYVTKEIMQKDQDFEVLKCVSEFLENTIDNLLGNPRTGSQFSPIFRTTLYRVARWTCSSCQKIHSRQLPPDTCYTMAAYVSGDECPLNQCILDLQTETQTGVSLVCGDGGCNATVTVDRVVTPKILSLPSLLIIRNNSLIESRKRLHVVYPETLDLTPFTCKQVSAPYSLRAVIFHHGYWIKHFSAHVKTEDGKWYHFNDEKVSGLVSRSGNCPPLETHKNYFSFVQVANKYRNRSGVRVSRGAFIWIYEKVSENKNQVLLEPPNSVLEYVLAQQKNMNVTDEEHIENMREKRESLLRSMAVVNLNNEFRLISRPLLAEWFNSQDLKFVPQPSLLMKGMCEHRKFDPIMLSSLQCIKKDKVEELLNSEYGIHSESKISLTFSAEEAFCKECIKKHVHHIFFREHIKDLQKQAKKEASKESQEGTSFIGLETLGNWTKLALNIYIKETGLDEIERTIEEEADMGTLSPLESETNGVHKKDDESCPENKEAMDSTADPEEKSKESPSSVSENGRSSSEESFTYFNEDIVCCHNMVNPLCAGLWLKNSLAEELKRLCSEMIHPALYQDDFGPCSDCQSNINQRTKIYNVGKEERKKLYHLFLERKRPHPSKDAYKSLYLLSREFLTKWRSFVRVCMKEEAEVVRPLRIENRSLLCKHNQLMYKCNQGGSIFEFAVIVWEEEWKSLNECYSFDYCVEVEYNGESGLTPRIGICQEGCVEEEADRLYEELFDFEDELINVKQVNSVLDVPSKNTNSEKEEKDEYSAPRKKPRLATLKENSEGGSSIRTVAQRLVRASRTFSSSDTIKEIQNFIAERTGIWPLLQTLWLSGGKEHGVTPFLLDDRHRAMTLKALRIKPGDTVYFRAAIEDMERAAGDGDTEYNEIED